MSDDKIKVYASLGDGKLSATLAYKNFYSEIHSEIATQLSIILSKYYAIEEILK
jgi:hypothetical protein